MAEQASRNELDVFAPQTPNDQAARMEVEVYVSAWQVAHEDVEAQIIGE